MPPALLPQSPQSFMRDSEILQSSALDRRFWFLETGFHTFDESLMHRFLLLTANAWSEQSDRFCFRYFGMDEGFFATVAASFDSKGIR